MNRQPKKLRIDRASSEVGIAYLEFIIALPFLVLFVISIVDLGRMINRYLLISQAVNAGALYAAGSNNLQEGDFQGLTVGQSCGANPLVTSSTAAPLDDPHAKVQTRISQMVLLENPSLAERLCINSQLSAPDATDQSRTVHVEVQAKYDSIFPIFKDFPITVAATAPYLK